MSDLNYTILLLSCIIKFGFCIYYIIPYKPFKLVNIVLHFRVKNVIVASNTTVISKKSSSSSILCTRKSFESQFLDNDYLNVYVRCDVIVYIWKYYTKVSISVFIQKLNLARTFIFYFRCYAALCCQVDNTVVKMLIWHYTKKCALQ